MLGTKALLTRFRESCSDADGNLVRIPHYVHISTAYTAGRRRGPIPETAHPHEVDYEAETRAALAMAESVEARSPDLRAAGCAAQGSRETTPPGRVPDHQ